jgi:hypothetical protein
VVPSNFIANSIPSASLQRMRRNLRCRFLEYVDDYFWVR